MGTRDEETCIAVGVSDSRETSHCGLEEKKLKSEGFGTPKGTNVLFAQWSHLFEEEGEQGNLYPAQLCTQLKIGSAIKEGSKERYGRTVNTFSHIIVASSLPS